MVTAPVDQFLESLRGRPSFDREDELTAFAAKHGDDPALLDAIVDAKLVPKHVACEAWATARGVAYVDPFTSVISEEAIAAIPEEVARKAKVLGLYLLSDVLTVAMATPDDENLLRRISQITQRTVSPVFAPAREIDSGISIYYSSGKSLEENLAAVERSAILSADGEITTEKIDRLAGSTHMAQVLDAMIFHAIHERASDLHFEPQESDSRLRLRIDGNLRTVVSYSSLLHRALMSRLKILCGLNISETRLPQDGRFSLPIGSESGSFRVSTIPSKRGEKAAVRILPMASRSTIQTLEGMLMSQCILQPFKRLVQNPNGIIFVTGPTGSGKTTTLYSALHEINSDDINISTIEDPIEIELEGVNQTQVNPKIDLSFAKVLRSLLRQDPDVILVGEIRDLETAKIATEAALTGHVVLATLHTNTAPQAITRLVDLGVEPCMVAPSVIGVLGQRLVRRICTQCKESYQPSIEVLLRHFHDVESADIPLYRGCGCTACRGTGFRGRIGFHELVVITDDIRTLVARGASAQEITQAAIRSGYQPLRYDGLKKALLGLTTIEEVEQATPLDWVS